mmetsp:Transcript_27332/g.62718  ORF Transcript_27332/g.62718 Transcript_27332/m.62718 type:complete len:103 (-) Transcript_27332:646-954(-)
MMIGRVAPKCRELSAFAIDWSMQLFLLKAQVVACRRWQRVHKPSVPAGHAAAVATDLAKESESPEGAVPLSAKSPSPSTSPPSSFFFFFFFFFFSPASMSER